MTGDRAHAVSVVIPALNEEATVAGVVAAALSSRADEVLVIDPDSTDNTARVAAAAGARVINWRDIDPAPPRPGKGEVLWRGIKAARGDVVVFFDADVTTVRPAWVDALAAPLANPDIHLVKAAYTRMFGHTAGNPTADGGRVTELTAKPLLRLYFPEIAHIDQPLAGEYAIRRDTALRLPFVDGYGVEVGLVLDVVKHYGEDAVTQVPLDPRAHRNRPLAQLAPMADVVARTIISRAGGPEVAQRPAWDAR